MLADIIGRSAHKFKERAKKATPNSTSSYENNKTSAALQVEADELWRFSQSEETKSRELSPAMLGYLAAYCYGHIQVTKDIGEYLSENGFEDIAEELDRIDEPFQERSLYVLTALRANR